MARTLIRMADGIEYKTCGTCGLEFPLDSEQFFVTYGQDGTRKIHALCKSCNAKKNRAFFLKSLYGLNPDDVDRMLLAQGGCCVLCGSSDPRSRKGWHVDHDHKTNRVRGLLCHPCNVALGAFGDDPEKLRRAADYLER